jgi:alkylation response protein AidB-like acyl-CoA dehydrogenase
MLTLHDSDAEAKFRGEIARWADDHLPPELRWRDDFEGLLAVDRLLSGAGLIGIGWPTEYGGRGVPPIVEAVLTDELGRVGVNRAKAPSHQGTNTIGPTLMVHGSDQQRARFLPAIIGVRELWCQGFSEPDAGSDLANVRTVAVDDGDEFVVTGSKIWTSYAQNADWMFALVRTGTVADRHKGLSFLLLPMNTPGITVRPIRQITGASEFCEVFLDAVRVPRSGLVGAIGDGWRVAMTLLSSERLSGRYRYSTLRRDVEALAGSHANAAGGQASVGPWLTELGKAVAAIDAIEAISLRVDSIRAAGKDPGALASVNKLWWPIAHQRLTELGLRISGSFQMNPEYWYLSWLEARPESIYGGSAQVQRNILSERHLHMPKTAKTTS